MEKIDCTIYDCEFARYFKGVIIEDTVYVLDSEGNPAAAKDYICEHIDFDMVQFSVGKTKETGIKSRKGSSKWGYFKLSTGGVVVQPTYEEAHPFYGSRARVCREGKYCFIDPWGRLVGEMIWDDTASSFRSNLCWVKKGDKFGYIDKDGAIIFSPQFEAAEQLEFIGRGDCGDSQYAALVKKDGKYGFINEKGEYIFEPSFESAKEFWSIGYAPVKAYEKWSFINRRGEFVVAFQFDEVGKSGSFSTKEVINENKVRFGQEHIDFYTVEKYGQWGIMTDDFEIFLPEAGRGYVVYRNMKIFIKDGRVTSLRELNKPVKKEG